jgi:phosphoribosyl 1,2-cyclic phosphodiesterase/CheY-like chemotaxis protein
LREKTALIIDDDEIIIQRLAKILEKFEWKVTTCTDAKRSTELASSLKPKIVFLDIIMPGCDGLEVCRKIKEGSEGNNCDVIILSSKKYSFDIDRAKFMGASAYLTKPFTNTDIENVLKAICGSTIDVKFWGVRGTLPVPGNESLKYGGNTSCISIILPDNNLIILDAGTGIRNLGSAMLRGQIEQKRACIFITHAHWDHINALPFFAPLYAKEYELLIYGPKNQNVDLKMMISEQMNGVYFPITVRAFNAQIEYHSLFEESFDVGDCIVETLLLSHPGNCLGYKIHYNSQSICYVTDNEIYDMNSANFNQNYYNKLVGFVKNTDLLITDTTYLDEEYIDKVHWGHSSVSQVTKLAADAGVKKLCLFHHDPDQDDSKIDLKLSIAIANLKAALSPAECVAPREGETIKVQLGKLPISDPVVSS